MRRRTAFNLSHTRLTTMQGGHFMPIGCIEVVPGDDIMHQVNAFVRATPQNAPIIQATNMYTMAAFIPNRLVYEDWEEFISGDNPVINPPTILINSGNAGDDRLADALGVGQIQSADDNPVEINCMALRAYNLFWNTYIRDQDYQTELPVLDAVDGDFDIQRVCWPRDEFTTARLTAQKGDAVTIPIGGTAPVIVDTPHRVDTGTSLIKLTVDNASGTDPATIKTGAVPSGAGTTDIDIRGEADLSQATSVPITDLRFALKLQSQRERRSRYGSRYEDIMLSDFGVRSLDARLQNPELLSKSHQRINWSEVLNTATADSGIVGEMFGHGIGQVRGNKYRYECQEHGYIIVCAFIRPSSLYTTVTPKHFFKIYAEDYFWPDFEHIGQQPIMLNEIYPGDDDSLTEVFGYRDRYDEYRRMANQVSREFTTTLNFWHFGRIFGTSKPVLNSTFLTCTPTNRVFQDTSDSTDKYWINAHHTLLARRPLSRSAAPRL